MNTDDLSIFSNVSSVSSNIIDKNNKNKNDENLLNISLDVNKNNKILKINENVSIISSSNNNTIKYDCELLNKIYIDVAVIHEDYNKIEVKCDYHTVDLDEISIPIELFQSMFYPYKDQFGINRDFFIKNDDILSFISFSSERRTVKGKKFYLLEELLGNIETDLCISRNCFTKESLVALTNEITLIKTLLDIKCCSVLSALSWENILDIINNYKYIKETTKPIPVLIVNIVFHTPTCGVKDTLVRFMYKITNM
jgi:hypothetical protein